MNLLIINGDRSLVQDKKGAFYSTLEEFHKYWDRIDVICPAVTVASRQSPITNLFGNVFVHPSPWPLFFQPWWIFKKGQQLYLEHKFDLITVQEYPPFYNGIGARLLWNKIRVPYILEIHHIPGYPKTANLKEWFYKLAMRCFIKYNASKARAVRVVNQKQVPEFLIKASIPENKVIYIPSMYINLDVFKPMDVEKKYDLIFIGRLTKNKGIDLLLETIKILVYKLKTVNPEKASGVKPRGGHATFRGSRGFTGCKLLIVGDGPLRESLKLKVKSLKLQNNVIFYGWAKDSAEVARLLNQSKVLIMSSYNEGGPRVVLEAMACGVPVITTKVGLMLDIIQDGENGLFTDWDSTDMADKIMFLLKNQELQRIFSQSGLSLAQKFEKKSTIKNYAEKLQEINR